MSTEIGVVLVHGIGNQAPGQLAREMMVRLRDEEARCDPKVHTLAHSMDATGDPTSASEALACRFNVHGAPVQLREANWAPLSHPDNPPRVRLAPYILPEFIDTVGSAWVGSPIGASARRLTRRLAPAAIVLWGTLGFAFAITTSLYLAALVWKESDVPPLLLAIVMASFGLYLTYRSLRYRWLVLRHMTCVRRVASCVSYSPIACVWGISQFLLFAFAAEILLFMAALVVAAVAVSYVAFPLAQLFAELGKLAAACRMDGVRRWVHRLGWVMVVLPVHTLLQATKASGNLISIVLCEKRMTVRAIAAGWLVGVYLGFALVAFLSELLILFPFVPFLALCQINEPASIGVVILESLFILAYLLFLKLVLPALDLLLDIGNYHIASTEDRSSYHQRVKQAVQSLRDSGCKEIHIVAHSLGSVVVYDWLSSTPSTDLPLRTLHTLGSPLDKFWYLDHTRRRRLADANCLANFPACRWTNYWAFSDVVSGALARYKATGAHICDKRVRWLGLMLASHVRYWTNAMVLAGIRNGIVKSEGSGSATLVDAANL